MIRRFYVMPLSHGISDHQVQEFIDSLDDADLFIPGLLNSSAGLDLETRTVIWEMTFVDEEAYTGAYMVHPYHMATLDNFLISDSPERIAHDIATMRYETSSSTPALQAGVRRVLLMKLSADADVSALEDLATDHEGVSEAVFARDDIAWNFPGKDTKWTHVMEQSFTDVAALDSYMQTVQGVATSSRDGLKRLGVDVLSLDIYTYPYSIKSILPTPESPIDDRPVYYSMTARVGLEDIEAFTAELENSYDKALEECGALLMSRWRTVEHGYREAEIQSVWRLESVEAFSPLRILTVTDPRINRFALKAMPLVRGGSRRFYQDL